MKNMEIPSFKKHQKVKFVIAGSEFIYPATQEIIWRYGKILFQLKSKSGCISYMILDKENKKKVQISKYLVFQVN
tara:strand:+ start:247 stop:471 length:225 start_codon:yes stop_codon:yes gene_type:complete